MSVYSERLAITVDLTISGTTFEFSGGRVRTLELDLAQYGFRGSAEVCVSLDGADDPLFEAFCTDAPCIVDLSVDVALPTVDDPPAPMSFRGLVREKTLREVTYAKQGGDILTRYYGVTFQDVPGALWGQHHPTELHVDSSVKDVIEQHVVEGIAFESTLREAEVLHKHVFLPLSEGVSLHDFLVWYADRNGGCLRYHYPNKTLVLAAAKSEPDTVYSLRSQQVSSTSVHFPNVRRHAGRVLNANADEAAVGTVDVPTAIKGIRRDVVIRTPIPAESDDRSALEAVRLRQPMAELDFTFSGFPTVLLYPGSAAKLARPYFKDDRFGRDETWRVSEVRLRATASDEMFATDWATESRRYDMFLTSRLEQARDPVARHPEFATPRYPVSVEGRVSRDRGESAERTYGFIVDGATSQPQYEIQIPLWDNQVIRAPYNPGFLPGHFYAPAFHGARVLLAIDLHSAELTSHLEWGPDVQVPLDGQGNHLLFGWDRNSETSVRHDYVDEKPTLTVRRVNKSDTELIVMEEGTLILQTRED